MKIGLATVLCICFMGVYAQNVGINPSGTPPHPSAGLDVNFSDKGLLPPRLTSTQRDAIVNPAAGLQIFNTTTGCIEYFNGTSWASVCGACTPLPTTANAGADQSIPAQTSVTLSGNTPAVGVGTWTIVSGSGGSIASPNSPNATFTGTAGATYVLRWTITNACGSSSDDVQIAFNNSTTGDKLVFMTSTTHTGNLGGISGADAICQARANAASLSGTFKAWLATSSSSPAQTFTQSSGNYRLVNGTIIASNWADLTDGSISLTWVNRDEFGNTLPFSPAGSFSGCGSWAGGNFYIAWAATNGNGTFYSSPNPSCMQTCNDWTSSTASPGGHMWIQWNNGNTAGCGTQQRLICVQQ